MTRLHALRRRAQGGCHGEGCPETYGEEARLFRDAPCHDHENNSDCGHSSLVEEQKEEFPCTPGADGSYGVVSTSDTMQMPHMLVYEYEVEIKPRLTCESMEVQVLPSVEEIITAELAHALLDCQGTQRHRQLHVVGLMPEPPDSCLKEVSCTGPLSDPSNSCCVVEGLTTLYSTPDLSGDRISTAMHTIRDALGDNTLTDGIHESVVGIRNHDPSFVASSPPPTQDRNTPMDDLVDDATAEDDDSLIRDPRGWFLLVLGCAVMGFFIGFLVTSRRKKRRNQQKIRKKSSRILGIEPRTPEHSERPVSEEKAHSSWNVIQRMSSKSLMNKSSKSLNDSGEDLVGIAPRTLEHNEHPFDDGTTISTWDNLQESPVSTANRTVNLDESERSHFLNLEEPGL